MSTPPNSRKVVITRKSPGNPKPLTNSLAPNNEQSTPSTWLSDMLKVHPYMEKLIKDHPADIERVMCIVCTDNNKPDQEGLKEIVACKRSWLKKHFQSSTHNSYIMNADHKKWMLEIINAMGRKKEEEEEVKLEVPKSSEINDCDSHNEESKSFIIDDLRTKAFPMSRITEAEFMLKIAKFVVVNHLPFDCGPKVLEFLKEMTQSYDLNLLLKAHTSRPMITDIIRYGIGHTLQTGIFTHLKKSRFSIIFDGTSDSFGGKYLGILVRYLNLAKRKVATKIIAILEMKGDTTGETLYNTIRGLFYEYDKAILENLVGLCSDNASNCISSKDKGCANRFMTDFPGVIHVRDLCHSYNLVCEESIKAFPKYIIDFLQKICSYFNNGLRANSLEQIQREQGVKEPLNILKFKEIRWLSMEQCAHRIIVLWEHLLKYFSNSESDLKLGFTEPEYKLYVQLLYVLLHKLNHYNVEFQKAELFIDHVLFKIKEGYLLFAKMILKSSHNNLNFEEIKKINFREATSKSYQQYLATDEELLDNLLSRYSVLKGFLEEAIQKRSGIKKELCGITREFIISCLIEMSKKLPFDNDIMIKSQAIYLNRPFMMKDWKDLALCFSNVIGEGDLIDFQEELECFEIQYDNICKNHYNSGLDIVLTWEKLSTTYRNIAKLAKALLVIPYSSALVESTFSKLKSFKTATRSQISAENLEASLIVNQYFKEESPKITEEMVKNYFKIREFKALSQIVEMHQDKNKVQAEEKIENQEQKNVESENSNYPSEFWQSTQPFLNMLYKSWLGNQEVKTQQGNNQINIEVLKPSSPATSSKRKADNGLIRIDLKKPKP